MGTFSTLITRAALSSIHKQFTQNNHTHKDIARKLSFRIVVPKSSQVIIQKSTNVKNVAKPGTRQKKIIRYTADDDKLILEHVQKLGNNIETWKILAVKLGRKYWKNIKLRYQYILIKEPNVRGRFTPEEDKIILHNVGKNGCSYKAWANTAKQLGRGCPESIKIRNDFLALNKEKKLKKWKLVEDKKLLEIIFRVKQINCDDISSLCSLNEAEFKGIAKELHRTQKSCHLHWEQKMLPILKTHILGLPLNIDWMRDLQRYIVDKKIKSLDELNYELLVDEMFPGQTPHSLKAVMVSSRYTSMGVLHKIPL